MLIKDDVYVVTNFFPVMLVDDENYSDSVLADRALSVIFKLVRFLTVLV